MSKKKVCHECGAVLKHPKRHRRWHRNNRPVPGPQGPPGPMGISEPHARWGDVKAEREGRTRIPADTSTTTDWFNLLQKFLNQP